MLGGNPALDSHPIQGKVQILLVPSCHRNQDNLRPDGPLGSYADFKLFLPVYDNHLGMMIHTGFFCGQNFELEYINVLLNKLIILLCVRNYTNWKITSVNLVQDTSILSDINRCCIAYIAFLNHLCITSHN